MAWSRPFLLLAGGQFVYQPAGVPPRPGRPDRRPGRPAAALREAALDRRRGHRPRQQPGGRRPRLTLTAKLLATILHDRHHLPQRAIAALLGVRHELISRYTSDIRRLLRQAGHTIEPAPAALATLDDLYRHATAAGITIPAKIKTAC